MKGLARFAVVLLVACAPPSAPVASSAPTAPTASGSTSARDRILARYCSGPRSNVNALEDDAGNLGGYAVTGPVMDGPVTYLDANGDEVGTFHIFSKPQTTEKVPGTIAGINARFPRSRRVGCA